MNKVGEVGKTRSYRVLTVNLDFLLVMGKGHKIRRKSLLSDLRSNLSF